MKTCVVCAARAAVQLLCRACEQSYDRAAFRDATTWGLLVWAAQRARRFERQRGAAQARAAYEEGQRALQDRY